MTLDMYGNETKIGDFVIVTPPHYRDCPFIGKAVSVGEKSVTVEYIYSPSKTKKRSVRLGFIRISPEMYKEITGNDPESYII